MCACADNELMFLTDFYIDDTNAMKTQGHVCDFFSKSL